MCTLKWVILFFVIVSTSSMPWDELMEEHGDDTAVVESTVRETRATAPEDINDLLKPGVKKAFLHTYGDKEDEDGDLLGYSRKMNNKGNDGYQHADGFHKKDSDKYGYELHTEYGQENKAKLEVATKNDKHFDENKAKEKEADDAEETQKSYKVVENVDDDRKYKKAIEGFDFGYYDGGNSEAYSEKETEENDGNDDSDSEQYNEESSSDDHKPHPTENESYSSGNSGSYSHSANSDDEDGDEKSSSYLSDESEDY